MCFLEHEYQEQGNIFQEPGLRFSTVDDQKKSLTAFRVQVFKSVVEVRFCWRPRGERDTPRHWSSLCSVS